MDTQLQELKDQNKALTSLAAAHERIIASLDEDKRTADAEKFVAKTLGPYQKRKLVGFIHKSRKVRGSIVLSAPAWKIREDLVGRATEILADLKTFSVDEEATLPSETA